MLDGLQPVAHRSRYQKLGAGGRLRAKRMDGEISPPPCGGTPCRAPAHSNSFSPSGIAVIGASERSDAHQRPANRGPQNSGSRVGIYLVNPKYGELQGFVLSESEAIGEAVDLALVAVPAPALPPRFGTAASKHSRCDHPDRRVPRRRRRGRKLEAELARAARDGRARIGPNCQGEFRRPSRMWCVFGSVSHETELEEGGVSCAFQSRRIWLCGGEPRRSPRCGFPSRRLDRQRDRRHDAGTPDAEFLDDPGTTFAFAYIEGTPNARTMLDVGRKSLGTGKPVLIWKGAQTEAGTKAAASHTANMTGNYDLTAAIPAVRADRDARRRGHPISRRACSARPLAQRPHIGGLSISGGSGIVFADRAVKTGFTCQASRRQTFTAAAKAIIPSFGSAENPADTTAGVSTIRPVLKTLEIVLADPVIDQLSSSAPSR